MSHELQNIPFFWTALAHWLTGLYYSLLLPKRLGRLASVPIAVFWLVLLQVFMYFTMPVDGMPFNLLMACFAVLTAAPLMILCGVDLRQTVYYGARSFMLAGLMASFSWQLYLFYAQRVRVLAHPAAQAFFILSFFALLFGLASLVELPNKEVDAELYISGLTCGGVLVIALMFYIVSSLSFAPIQTPFGGATYADAFNIRSLVYFSGVLAQMVIHVQLCETHVTMERDALENILAMQYRNYQTGQESMDLINQKYHDLKHQIAVLRSEAGNGQKMEYLDDLEREIQIYETQGQTGNEILDAILGSKSLHCQREGIKLTYVTDGAALSFLDIMDISALFGNALDNAIEAVGKLPDSEQRLIHLVVNRRRNVLRIRVENRYGGALSTVNGLLRTTKEDARYHGYGIKSIMMTTEKYGGSVTYTAKDGWFELRIMIPIPDPEEGRTTN